ncbi:hypothetical protein GCM10010423_33490 [Streptomyces levis]|uniref:DUF2335 domain-containing protein n=1 Tax=Streptomyces levis TaxID=285566 RepID=A0ABN3NUP4_9ACTN
MADELRVVVPGSDALLGPTRDALIDYATEYSSGLLREAERLEAMNRNGAGPAQITVIDVRDANYAVRRNLVPQKKDWIAQTLFIVSTLSGIATGWFANHTDETWGLFGFVGCAVLTVTTGLLGALR